MFFVRVTRFAILPLRQLFAPSRRGLLFATVLLSFSCLVLLRPSTAGVQNQPPLGIVSAASNEADALAPESLATAYGLHLATQSDIAAAPQLQLGGTTVEVAGRAALLLFVSPEQVNFLIPAGVPPGPATVTVRSGDGTISTGTTNINTVSPALFTAGGVVSGFALRVKANGALSYEPVAEFDAANGQYKTKAIDPGISAGDLVFLVFYLSGVRGADPAQVHVVLGGDELTPVFAGAVPGIPGLDQINLLLPGSLAGKGVLDLIVTAPNARASNPASVEIGGGISTLTVSQLSKQTVVASETLEIEGTNLPTSNVEVLFAPNVGVVPETATPTKMTLRVPFGVEAGTVKINVNNQIAWVRPDPLDVVTSVSGFVQEFKDNARVGVAGLPVVMVEPSGRRLETVTNSAGGFLFRDAAPSSRSTIQIGGQAANALNYQMPPFGIRVRGRRDNQFSTEDAPRLVEVTPNGSVTTGLTVADAPVNETLRVAAPAGLTESAGVITAGQVSFDTNNSAVTCPSGAPGCQLALAVFDAGRAPANLPAGIFSSTIAQITPFSATLTPGGKLTFPNSDAIPAGTPVGVFRFDQTPESATFGQFVDIGAGTVSADGQRLETVNNAVTQASYYFISRQWPTATIIGHVVETDGVRPVRRAVVSARGQSTFTDGNGGFVLRNVPVIKTNDAVTLEVSFHRADGSVSRTERAGVGISAGAQVTLSTDISLPQRSNNGGPSILAPAALSIAEGETREFNFIVTGLAANALPAFSGAPFATLRSLGNEAFALRLAPPPGGAGSYPITLAAGSAPNLAQQTIAVTVLAANANVPIAQDQAVTTDEDTPKAITLAGTNAGNTPGYAIVAFPLHGTLTGTPPNVVYTPAANYNGTDSFRFRVGGGNDMRSFAEVSLAIRPVNDPPLLTVPGAQTIGAGQTLALTITAVDPDGDVLTLTAPNAPSGATQNPPQTAPNAWRFTWTPTVTQDGDYTINFTVSDNAAPPRGDTKTITARVEAKWANTSGPEGQFGVINALLASGGNVYAATEGGGISRSLDDGRTWNQANVGLGGGLIFKSLAVLGTELFAGGGNDTYGVYRSPDQGQTWIASGLDGYVVFAITSFGGNLFAGAYDGGIFRSTDRGRTWTAVNQGIPIPLDQLLVTSFGVNGSTLFAGSLSGIFRSLDQGNNWMAISTGATGLPENSQGLAFAILGNTIFVSTGFGVYRSTNNGANWTPVAEPVGSVYSESLLASGNTLYAGTGSGFDGTGGEGVYRSTDGGQSWTQINQGLTTLAVKALAVTPTSLLAGTVGGNVFRSINQGQNWTPSGAGLRNTYITAVISSNGVTLASVSHFGSFRNGIYRSPDNGQTWTSSNTGLPDVDVIGFGINGTTFFAGTDGAGVYRSTDQGRTWVVANNGLPNGKFEQFAVVGNTIYTGAGRAFDSPFSRDRGVYRSTDNGQSWTAINAGLQPEVIDGETFYPPIGSLAVKGTTLFAKSGNALFRLNENATSWITLLPTGLTGSNFSNGQIAVSGNSLVVGTSSGLFRSTDDGVTFTRSQNAGFLSSLLASGDNVYAGGRFGVGIYFSSDQGRTFKRLNNSLTNTDVSSLAISGTNVFVGTGGLGVFLLTNNVQSWSETNTGLAEEDKLINTVAVNGATLLAGTLGRGVLRSLDHGQSWAPANLGLPPSPSVQGFAFFGSNTYLGAFGQGVFRSTNNGASWSAASAGLANLFVNALQTQGAALLAGTDAGVFRTMDGANWISLGLSNQRVLSLGQSADGQVLLAGTNGGGVFRSTDNGQTWMPVTAGPGNQVILALTIGNDGATLFAGTDGGVFHSTDQGATWSGVGTGLPSQLSVRSFAVSGGKLYAGSFLGVFLTEDGGASWKQINAGLLDIRVGGLALDGDALLVGTSRRGLFLSAIPNNVCPLNIAVQPGSRSVAGGQTATLNVTAAGVPPIRYQWYRGASGDFSQPIGGATGNSFTTPALNATANYWVLVTSGCGSVNSETATVLVNAAPQADLAVTQTITPAQPKPGDDLTFALNLTNAGRDTAFAVTVTDALPNQVTVISCNATGGGVCGGTGNNRVVTFSALTAGASATVTIVARVNAGAGGATLRSTASVSAGTADTNPANNTDIKSLTVQNTAPVISSLSPNTAIAGGAEFTLTVNGSNFVTGAKVRWNGGERQTSFGSATQLTAQIPGSDIAAIGTATVTVANPDGQTSNSMAFTIAAPPRQNSVLRVVASTGSVGSTVAVPIELVSQGDENALGFSLTFDPAILSNPQVALGNGASGAALNPNLNQAAAGRVGLVLAMPSGQQFSVGARQIAVITFMIAANTGAATASLEFGNQPIPREVVDANANELGAIYVNGAVTITRGFEADVAPRPNGNGSLSVTDWVLVGRFASGDLAVEPGSEFQRTDCAPRSTFGNGAITVSDWVQAGRYAAGLEPLTPAAGPTAPGALAAANLAALLKTPDSGWPRLLRVSSPTFGVGQTSAVTVELLAQGEENAVSFSLQFDARQWRFVSATVGEDAQKAVLSVNTKLAADGHIGFALALPPGKTFEAGMQSVLAVNFMAEEGGGMFAPEVAFGDWPATRELADVRAEVLTADWMPAALSLFTVPLSNADEQGLAAGVVIRVGADGRQSFEPLAVVDSRKNGFVAVPIEVGDENEQVFLALFGTGWQNGAALDAIQVTVDGLPVEVLYAGAQGGEAGMAQLNLRLPSALSGRGDVTVQFSNAGRSANPVKVIIK